MPKCCATCPFRASLPVPLDASTLERTIGANLRDGFAHRCHNTLGNERELVCAGFLRFVEREGIDNRMVSLGRALGVFGPVANDPPLLRGGWSDIVAAHDAACFKQRDE